MFNPLTFLKGGVSKTSKAKKRRAGRQARKGISRAQAEQRQAKTKKTTIWQDIMGKK